MDTSDDEVEALPDSVGNYDFLDHDDEPISFSVLPLLWSEDDRVNPSESSTAPKGGVFLHGSADQGLKTIYKEVRAWKFDLAHVSPEISVLSKENNWFKLQKPRKSYEGTIRSVMITVNCLHYLKTNPESSAKSLWDYMAKAFSTYEVRPAAKDLAEHTSLISEAIKRDDGLAKCKFIANFLEEKPWLRKLSSEDVQSPPIPSFIVEDDEMEIMEDDPDAEEDEDVFDSVCAICDNGGDLLCCEGRCMRSFHATTQAGEDSICASLGLTDAEVEAIQQFVCQNCMHKQHQCFVCGKLGSSDKSSGAEVFSCVSATCGRFYHSHCVAKLLIPKDVDAAKELQKTIAAGKSFTCPIHKCFVCGKGEQKKTPELQFAVCRRCPRSYHRQCLPKGITFEDSEGEGATRAWEGLLPNRVLIYCLKHELDEELGTPVRNHVKFPRVDDKKTAMTLKRKKPTPELSSGAEKTGAEKKIPASNELSRMSTKAPDQKEKISSLADRVKRKNANVSSQQEIRKKAKVADVPGQSQKNSKKVGSLVRGKSSSAKEKEETVSLGQRLYNLYVDGAETEEVQPLKEDDALASETPSKQLDYSLPKLDADSERRIQDIIKEATSSVSMQDILEKRNLQSTQNLKSTVDRAITMGKLEGAVEAVQTALQKIEEGGSIEDAQAVCDPDVLRQLFKWKDKLKVYLSPFIFGTRYTSFGRHFTKVDKLQEIVDKLHWYVQNGDTIVDFCCGANDFSCLMAKKLEESGKNCSYKNYDLFPSKNAFNFERRDWYTVSPKELPPGNKLIMGLNPPFGLNASLANKFIDKALEFKPKLLILIVPPETQRLDKKKSAYDLVWEDNNFLSGKSFYLPGSVDENDKQMDQWNLNTPVLYLWSRPGWTPKHKAIARKQGHLGEKGTGVPSLDSSGTADPSDQGGVPSAADDGIPIQNDQTEETKEGAVVSEGRKGISRSNSGKETLKSQEENHSGNGCRKKQRGKMPEESPPPSSRETNIRSPVDVHSSRSDMSLDSDVRGTNHQPHHESLLPEYEEDYAAGLDTIVEDIGRTYGLTSDDFRSRESFSASLSPHREYRARSLEEPNMGDLRERAEVYGSSSITQEDERYWRALDMRTQVRLYGRQDSDPSQRTSVPPYLDPPPAYLEPPPAYLEPPPAYLEPPPPAYLEPPPPAYLDPHPPYLQARPAPSTYGLVAPPLAEPSYHRNTSAMQRYAPRLDELNPPRRVNGVGPDPLAIRRPGIYDPRPPPQVGYQGNRQGFAPGPYSPFSQTNSSGWLNE